MDVTNMLTEKELRLLDTTNQETPDLLQTLTENIDDKCSKCQTSKIDKMYIAGHDVLHCICTQCGYEWVE